MSSEPNSEANNVTPLSQARLNRKGTSSMIEVSEDRLRDILSSVVSDQLTQKMTRLENSINRVVSKFEAVRNGSSEDAALRVTTNFDNTDIALSAISLPKEDHYPYTCTHLAEVLNIRNHDVIQRIKILDLRNNPIYHICIPAGKTSYINKWSEATLQKLREIIASTAQ
ncbi:MAG: hypothetical protein V7K21_19920 [Nostoc sp.]|uniref:hypothetical protein n=1 Tax=Nostoc sp. TaxID=1180 RepID=UPI002FFAFC10